MPSDAFRVRVAQALLEETAEDLYEHAPCGYLSTLPDGTIVRVNQTLIEWTGTRATRSWPARSSRPCSRSDRGSTTRPTTRRCCRCRDSRTKSRSTSCARTGGILPVLVNSRQRRSDDGTPLFNRITLFDATDRRRYERELLLARRKAEQVAKDKADLLAMLSHDIRNPLNAVMGVVQLLDAQRSDRRAASIRPAAEVLVGEHAEAAQPRAAN